MRNGMKMTVAEMVTYDQVVCMKMATADEINTRWASRSWASWTECLSSIIYEACGCHSIGELIEREEL